MMNRVRGFKSLVVEAVDQGSRALEKVQIETAKMPFNLVEQIPGLKVPAGGVRLIYNTSVSGVHGMIRLVTKVAGDTLDVVLDAVEPLAGAEKTAGKAAEKGAEKTAGKPAEKGAEKSAEKEDATRSSGAA
jgi:hypothetical protein